MPYVCNKCGKSHDTGSICNCELHIAGFKLPKEGVKYDEGKTQWALLPPYSLEEVAKVYTYGATKYAANNWRKGMAWSRTFSAVMRHCWKFWRGETYDKETGLHHMAHAAFGCLTLIEYTRTKTPTDDRPFRVTLRKGSK